jgi:hypothetical protein
MWIAYPPKAAAGQPIEVPQSRIDDSASDEQWVDVLRARLTNLGWLASARSIPS